MAIIQRLVLKRFKGFRNFSIDLGKMTVLVGRNGAGKTTLLEALYMAQLALRRVFGGTQNPRLHSPQWQFDFAQVLRFGVSKAKAEDLWFHRQLNDPLELRITYSNGLTFILKSTSTSSLNTRLLWDGSSPANMTALPQEVRPLVSEVYAMVPLLLRPLGAFQAPERHMAYNDMQRRMDDGRLAEVWRNFVFWQYDADKESFREAMEKLRELLPWARVREPEHSRVDDTIQILYEDTGDAFDLSSGGGGLSTVLSVLIATELGGPKLVLLDEPDAHLHPSLQSQIAESLCELAQQEGRQIIVATHAPEFVASVPIDCVRWVDRQKQSAERTTSATRVLELLGSLTKAQALILDQVKAILWLEGWTDLELLKAFAKRAGKEELLCHRSLRHAFGLKEGDADRLPELQQLLTRLVGRKVHIVALRDADYTRLIEDPPREVQRRGTPEARLLVLGRKEIENYLLDPDAIAKAYAEKSEQPPTREEVMRAIKQYASNSWVRDRLRHKFIPEATRKSRAEWTNDKKHREAENRFNELYSKDEWLLESLPGKEALAAVKQTFGKRTGVTLTPGDICRRMDVPRDILVVLEAIEQALS